MTRHVRPILLHFCHWGLPHNSQIFAALEPHYSPNLLHTCRKLRSSRKVWHRTSCEILPHLNVAYVRYWIWGLQFNLSSITIPTNLVSDTWFMGVLDMIIPGWLFHATFTYTQSLGHLAKCVIHENLGEGHYVTLGLRGQGGSSSRFLSKSTF